MGLCGEPYYQERVCIISRICLTTGVLYICMSNAKGDVTIQNDAGMHLRPAAAFVHTANKHKECEILVSSGDQRVNGKSIMGLVMLAASKGTELTIECNGNGSEEALKELVDLVNNKFGTEN